VNGLLEVVTDELVVVSGSLLEPRGVALVELGTGAFGNRLVGGFVDEYVPKSERILSRPPALCVADELFPQQGEE
jgi:hypothetical protein